MTEEFGQLFRGIQVDFVSRPGNDVKLCILHQSCQLPGGFLICSVPLAAEHQGGTGDPRKGPPKIQLCHGGAKADQLLLVKPALGKGGAWQKTEQ